MTTVYDHPAALSMPVLPVARAVRTEDRHLATQQEAEAILKAWDDLIDRCLVEWGRNPASLADEDFVPPSPRVIDAACEWALRMRDLRMAPPLRIVPDGEGGICFERGDRSCFEILSILSDGTVRLQGFDNCKMVVDRTVG